MKLFGLFKWKGDDDKKDDHEEEKVVPAKMVDEEEEIEEEAPPAEKASLADQAEDLIKNISLLKFSYF